MASNLRPGSHRMLLFILVLGSLSANFYFSILHSIKDIHKKKRIEGEAGPLDREASSPRLSLGALYKSRIRENTVYFPVTGKERVAQLCLPTRAV
eukprot:786249-Pelagomonas_calceolata.AAC.7